MRRKGFRIGLRAKFIFLFAGLGIMMILVTGYTMAQYVIDTNEQNYMSTMWGAAYTISEEISVAPGQLRGYALTGETDEEYERLCEDLRELVEKSELIDNYFILCPVSGTEAFFVTGEIEGEQMEAGSAVEDFGGRAWDVCREVLQEAESETDTNYRSRGHEKTEQVSGAAGEDMKVSAYYPIADSDGGFAAILGVEEYTGALPEEIKTYVSGATAYIMILFLIQAVILLVFVQLGIIGAIRRLRDGVERLSDGELDVSIACKRRDELGAITECFNRMAARIGGHIRQMEAFNAAYQKFIPPVAFQILQRESIVDVCLGDQALTELSVLVMEPEKAGGLLPGLDSEQTFSYINGMFARLVPAVLAAGGSVWRYEKAAVYALFQNSPRAALNAAIAAGERLRQEGETIAAGIVREPVMIGVAGHEEHMDILKVSGQTLETFLKDIAARYYASILIAGRAAAEISDFERRYHVRFLGYVRLPSGSLEGVYDVFDADTDGVRSKKRQTLESFAAGVSLYTQGKLKEAREAFIDVLRIDRGDAAAREYAALCGRAMKEEKYRGQVWFAELGG